jgi:ParB/RepB/Spo0J family partition protein
MSETATLEPPVVETTPELIVNRFDADGICQDPETVKVLMPKGYTCLLYLAVDPDGGWRHGCDCSGSNGKEPLASMARLERPAFIDRRQALRMAMQEAMDYFVKNRKASKAVKALETFYAANLTTEEGSPANLSTDSGQAPPEGMETGPARGEFAEIPVAAISPNPANHRKHIDPDELAALAESIRLEGLLQPIAVRELPHEEMPAIADAAPPAPRYELILGERRWRAHELLKAASIQAKVYRSISAGRAKVLALIENLQRVNLNPIEEAEGYADLAEEGLQQDQIAERVGRSRPAVTNALRLLKLPAEVIAYIRTGKLTPAHGVAILRFDGWPIHERVMGDLAIRDKVRAGDMERGVPFAYELEREGRAHTR